MIVQISPNIQVGYDNLVQSGREFVREGCLQKLSRKGYQQRMFFLVSFSASFTFFSFFTFTFSFSVIFFSLIFSSSSSFAFSSSYLLHRQRGQYPKFIFLFVSWILSSANHPKN